MLPILLIAPLSFDTTEVFTPDLLLSFLKELLAEDSLILVADLEGNSLCMKLTLFSVCLWPSRVTSGYLVFLKSYTIRAPLLLAPTATNSPLLLKLIDYSANCVLICAAIFASFISYSIICLSRLTEPSRSLLRGWKLRFLTLALWLVNCCRIF